MITVNIQDASAQFPRLIEQVMAGESVMLCQNNVPVVEMKKPPVSETPKKRKPSLGNAPFPLTLSDDAFDPLPDDMWNMFNGYDDKHGL